MAIPELYLPQWGQQAGQNLLAGQMRRREQEQRNALSQALPGALGGDQTAMNRLLQVSPKLGVQVYGQQQTRQQALGKEKEAAFQGALTNVAKGILSLPPERRPEAWTASATRLAQLYPEQVAAQQITPEWDETVEPELYGLAGAKQFEPEKPKNPYDRYETVGRTIFDLETKQPVYSAPESARQSFSVTAPDGTVIQYGDVTGNKPAVNAAFEARTGAENLIGRLDEIASLYNAEDYRLAGRAKAAFAGAKDYIGAPLGKGEAERLDRASKSKSALIDNLSRYVKEISGAAASDKERELLSNVQPTDKDGPAVIEAKIARLRAAAELIVERENQRLRAPPTTPGAAGGGSGGWSIAPVQ